MTFTNLKIGPRIALGFGTLLALLLAVSVTALMKLGHLDDENDLLVNDRLPKLEHVSTLTEAVLNSARYARSVLLLDDKARVKSDIASLRQSIAGKRPAIPS